ncbi:MAG: site-specific DNA-methyltransferase [Deltaproteobacteria bacterium]|nr:site-specific DNA-methyltransferase [Deltaproteobacteria bacterium]
MTELIVQMRDIDTVFPYEKNAKKHPANQVEQIARSISDFGFNVPILIDKSNLIICGVGRYLAARKLNLSRVPVAILDSLSDEQVKKFRLADNKVAESKWDEVLLIEDLQGLKENGYSVLDIPGFSESDIDKLLNGLQDNDGHGDPDRVPDKKEDHGIKKGDLFALGDHRLLCGDSTSAADVSRLLDGVQCNMCFTDPPYNVNYQGSRKAKRKKIENDNLPEEQFYEFMSKIYKNISAALVPGGAFYICHADSMWKAFREPLAVHNLLFKQCLMWVKNQFVLSRAHYHYRHEPILYGHKKGKRFWNGGRHNDSVLFQQTPSIVVEEGDDLKTIYINTNETTIIIAVPEYDLVYQDDGAESVWHFAKPEKSKEHPTMKPVDLVKRGIRNSSALGDIIFDPFLGSGTTLIAAEGLNRVCFGLEFSPDYCDVIIRRWEEYTGSQAQLFE